MLRILAISRVTKRWLPERRAIDVARDVVSALELGFGPELVRRTLKAATNEVAASQREEMADAIQDTWRRISG